MKRAFIPKEECLAEFDYSQIEPRLFAYFAAKLGDPTVADMYRAGMDVYRTMAAGTLGIAADAVTPEQRQDFKTFFLMILYGAGPKKISAELGMPYAEAKQYYIDFHNAWPQVRMISNPPPRKPYPSYEPGAIERVLKRRGYIQTIAGRRLAPGMWEEHKMLNKLIQGSAAEVMKRALIRVWKAQQKWDYAHMVLTVHDSILFDALEAELTMLHEEVPKLMDEPKINDIIPVVVEMKVSDTSWADAKEYAA